MGRLVTFTPKPKGNRQKPAKDADVLIFTGVRYERTGRPGPGTRTDTPGKPRRKRG